MLLATSYPAGGIFLSMFEFFIFFVWLMLLFRVFGDVFADHELSGGVKALWLIFVILVPFLGVFVYLIARGPKMAERSAAAMAEAEKDQKAYIRDAAAGGSSTADELQRLANLRDSGVLTEEEFQVQKAKALG